MYVNFKNGMKNWKKVPSKWRTAMHKRLPVHRTDSSSFSCTLFILITRPYSKLRISDVDISLLTLTKFLFFLNCNLSD